MSDEPICRRSKYSKGKLIDGCVAPLSEIKLSSVDKLILQLFIRAPWVLISTFSEAGIVKDSLDWSNTESLARAMKIPWNSYVIKKLEIAQNEILKQQDIKLSLKKG